MRSVRRSRGFFIVFNLLGLGMMVSAAVGSLLVGYTLAALAVPMRHGMMLSWVTFFVVLIAADLKARSASSQHPVPFVHPSAGGHIFFAPVWALGVGFAILALMLKIGAL